MLHHWCLTDYGRADNATWNADLPGQRRGTVSKGKGRRGTMMKGMGKGGRRPTTLGTVMKGKGKGWTPQKATTGLGPTVFGTNKGEIEDFESPYPRTSIPRQWLFSNIMFTFLSFGAMLSCASFVFFRNCGGCCNFSYGYRKYEANNFDHTGW